MAKKTVKKKVAKKKTVVKKKTVTKKKAAPAKKKAVKKTAAKKTKKKTKKKSAMSAREKVVLLIMQGLIKQKEVLLKDAAETLNILPGDLNYPDMGDQATAETDRNFMLRLRDRERGLLKKIDKTIERISHKTYGFCEACESEIGTKRLQARPVTALCIDCKTEQEEEERIARGK
jgi:DnaK suppressor protein